jgi:nucleotide-binding universal stress UspA family protein
MDFEHAAARLTDVLVEVAASRARPRTAHEPGPANAFDRPCPGLTIRHILVPMDGSALAECALPFASALGKVLSARITVLRVLTAPSGHVDPVEWELVRAEAHGQLARFERQLTASGLSSDVALLDGRSAEQIIHFAQEHHVDLIVLSSHGEGGLTGWVLSSTAQKVVARAHSCRPTSPRPRERPNFVSARSSCRSTAPRAPSASSRSRRRSPAHMRPS